MPPTRRRPRRSRSSVAGADRTTQVVTLVAGPDSVDFPALRELLVRAHEDPDAIDERQVAQWIAEGPSLLKQIAEDPSLLARFNGDPAAILNELGVSAPANLAGPLPHPAEQVVSAGHAAAVAEQQERILRRLSNDSTWTEEFRLDPIAAVITLTRGEPATVTAELIRQFAPPATRTPAAQTLSGELVAALGLFTGDDNR